MKKIILSIAMLFMAFQTQAGEVKLMSQPKLTLEAAKIMIEAAKVEAANQKSFVTISVVNPDGTLIAMEKMDYTPKGTVQAAIKKSQTAIEFGLSTQMISNFSYGEDLKGGMLPYLGSSNQYFAVAGGNPIIKDNQLLGAVGISGAADPRVDDKISAAAIKALIEKL